jgi:molybdenum cofactor synthesis domain-containing protein
MPLCDVAAVDGFAVSAAAIADAAAERPVTLAIPLQAEKLFVGMPVPKRFDTLVPAEQVKADLFQAEFSTPSAAGANIAVQGSDVKADDIIAAAGAKIGAEQLRKLAAQGVTELNVYLKPRIGIISIGDDIVDITTNPEPGQVRDSNRYVLECVLREWGCETFFLGLSEDVTQAIVSLINRGRGLDAMIMTGGASVAENDYITSSFAAIGAYDLTWGGDFTPGGTFAFACLGITPLIGLSGQPREMLTTLETVIKPALLQLAGLEQSES